MEGNLEPQPENFVTDAGKLITLYGKWPSFHDAEVLSLVLDRTGPILVMRIALHEKHRNMVDERGSYLTVGRCIATLRFEGVDQLAIEEFNHQNVLSGMVFEMDGTLHVHVTLAGIFGISARFQCLKVAVEDVLRTHPDVFENPASQ